MNKDQEEVLSWLEWSVKEQGNSPIDAIYLLRDGEALDSTLSALMALNNQQEFEVLAALAQFGLEQEKAE